MLTYSKTPMNILLLGLKDSRGVFVFPNTMELSPGVELEAQALMPIIPQLIERGQSLFTTSAKIQIDTRFSEMVRHQSGRSATLFLASTDADPQSCKLPCLPLPTLLQQMPKDKNRVPWMKAFQAVAGGFEETVKAVDREEVVRHLKGEIAKSDTDKSEV